MEMLLWNELVLLTDVGDLRQAEDLDGSVLEFGTFQALMFDKLSAC